MRPVCLLTGQLGETFPKIQSPTSRKGGIRVWESWVLLIWLPSVRSAHLGNTRPVTQSMVYMSSCHSLLGLVVLAATASQVELIGLVFDAPLSRRHRLQCAPPAGGYYSPSSGLQVLGDRGSGTWIPALC